MGQSTAPPPQPDYGIDAPPVIRNLLLVAGTAAAAAVLLHFLGVAAPVGVPLREILLIAALNFSAVAAAMVWYSKVGKVRGLFLIGAAKRLTTGRAVGIDLWQKEDLSGNRPEATMENARREGVADRVEVRDGDARQLPFPDATFDVVVSSLALHNIYDRAGRERAVREIARVLKPGGRVAIEDIRHTDEYARVLAASGLNDVRRWATVVGRLVMVWTWGGVRPFRVLGRKPALPAAVL